VLYLKESYFPQPQGVADGCLQKVRIVVPVSMTSCHVPLKLKTGPVAAQTITSPSARTKAIGLLAARDVQLASQLKNEEDCPDLISHPLLEQTVEPLTDAAGRGVDVNIFLPGTGDEGAAYYAGRSYYTRLPLRLQGSLFPHSARVGPQVSPFDYGALVLEDPSCRLFSSDLEITTGLFRSSLHSRPVRRRMIIIRRISPSPPLG